MIKGTRWVYEVVAFNPQTRIAMLEHDSRNIRDVNTDDDGKPLDPAWREIVPLPPPPDDDCDDCDDDAFSRPARRVETIYLEDLRAEIEAPEPIEPLKVLDRLPDFIPEAPAPFAWDFASHRILHASSPEPSCPFCKGRA